MVSVLSRYYPYRPIINSHGGIDPTSIHGKKPAVVLTLAVTAIASTFLYRKTTHTWTLLGTAVFGCISYLVISTLGQSIPQQLADQSCIPPFLSTTPIPENIAKRVLANNNLHAVIYRLVLSTKNATERAERLDNYFSGLWSLASPSAQQQQLLLKAVQTSSCHLLHTLDKKTPCLSLMTDQEVFNLWISAKTSFVIQALKKIFAITVTYKGKNLVEFFISQIIENQNEQETCESLITSMDIFLSNEAPRPVQTAPYQNQIKQNSALANFLNRRPHWNKAELLLITFLE